MHAQQPMRSGVVLNLSCNCILEIECKGEKLDILYVVDGSGSVGRGNFDKVRAFLKHLTARFDIGTDETHVGLMQFGRFDVTDIAFGLGEKNSKAAVDEAIDDMKYLNSATFTGDALQKARENVRRHYSMKFLTFDIFTTNFFIFLLYNYTIL